MKKCAWCILLAVLVASCLCAANADGTAGIQYRFDSTTNAAYVTGYTGSDDAVIIPEQLWQGFDSFSVVGVDDFAFYGSSVKYVVFPSTIQNLGTGAFYDCDSLEYVNMENSQISSFGTDAFSGCMSLQTITLPRTLRELGERSFDGCTSLKRVFLPQSIEHIGNDCFEGCTSLTECTIMNSSALIQNNAFSNVADNFAIRVDEYGVDGIPSYNPFEPIPETMTNVVRFAAIHRIPVIYLKNVPWLIPGGNSWPDTVKVGETVNLLDCLPEGIVLTSIQSDNPDILSVNTTMTTMTGIAPGNATLSVNYAGDFYSVAVTVYKPVTSFEIQPSSAVLVKGTSAVLTISQVNPADGYPKYTWSIDSAKSGVVSITSADNATCEITAIAEGETSIVCQNISGVSVSCRIQVTADESDPNHAFQYRFDNENAVAYITSFTGTYKHVIIPDKATDTVTCSIVGIDDHAFSGSAIQSLTLPSTLQTIGDYAFANCLELESVDMSDGQVAVIGTDAFSGCAALNSISLSSSLTDIGNRAFSGCESLCDISLPDGLTTIGAEAFAGCASLSRIAVPESVISINDAAFANCGATLETVCTAPARSWGEAHHHAIEIVHRNLVVDEALSATPEHSGLTEGQHCDDCGEVLIPQTKTHYYESENSTGFQYEYNSEMKTVYLIAYDGNGENVEIPEQIRDEEVFTVIGISENAFSNAHLKSLVLPLTLQYIGDYAFSECHQLESVDMESSKVAFIASGAFSNCTSLESIKLPATLISIGDHAFSGCTSLGNLTLPDGITVIGAEAFSGCSTLSLLTLPDSVTDIDNSAFNNCGAAIKTGCTTQARYWCETYGREVRLIHRNIVIDEAVAATAEHSGLTEGQHCDDCGEVLVPQSIKHYYEGENSSGFQYRCDQESKTACLISYNGACEDVVIPEQLVDEERFTVTGIYDNAFSGTILKSLRLPSTLQLIGNHAFSGCLQLESVDLESTQVTVLPSGAFSDCTSLESVSLPSTLTTIGYQTFSNCSVLSVIAIPDTVISIDDMAFDNCNATIKTGCTSYASVWCNAHGQKVKRVHGNTVVDEAVAATTTHTGLTEGQHCDACGEIFVPQVVTHYYETENTSGFRYQYDKDAKTAILTSYSGMDEDVVIPDQVLDTEIFTVVGIDDNAFSGSSLKSLKLPSTLRFLGQGALSNCLMLETVSMEQTQVTTIESDTFNGCTTLKNISLPPTLTAIGECAFSGCTALSAVTIPDSVTDIHDMAFVNCDAVIKTGCIAPARAWCDAHGQGMRVIHHNIVTDEAVEATPEHPGLTEGYHCDDCGYVLIPQTSTSYESESGIEELQTPGNLHWVADATATATWDAVEDANYYSVRIHVYDEKGNEFGNGELTGTPAKEVDLQAEINRICKSTQHDEDIVYIDFTVQARRIATGGAVEAESPESPHSAAQRYSRFIQTSTLGIPQNLQFNEDRTASWDVVEDAINYGICFKIINKDNSVIEIPCAEITPDSYNIIDGRVVADFDLILTKACKAYVNGSVEVCYKLYSRASNNPKYRFDKSPYSDPSNSIAYYSFLPVTGITLSPEKPFIHVNNSYYLGKTIQPGNAYYEAVAWSSANDTIVSVNEQGMITGVATGVAEVTATIHDDTTTEPVSATVPVTVYSIATNVADGNNQQTVTDTAGTIIDDIGNSANPNISNTDISSDEIGGIQEQIHEGMERGDEFHTDWKWQEHSWDYYTSWWDRILNLLSDSHFACGYDAGFQMYHKDNAGQEHQIGNIVEFDQAIDFNFDLPALPRIPSYKNREFSLFRIHNGELELIPVSIGEDGKFYASSDKFSDFVLVYQDTDKPYEEMSTLKLPAGTKRIESEAFAGTASEVIIIPAGCEYVAEDAFNGCDSLVYVVNRSDAPVTLPDGVQLISE